MTTGSEEAGAAAGTTAAVPDYSGYDDSDLYFSAGRFAGLLAGRRRGKTEIRKKRICREYSHQRKAAKPREKEELRKGHRKRKQNCNDRGLADQIHIRTG